MNDETTTIADLKKLIATFVAERDWEQFHDPKNLVMALTSEVGELADIFRWVTSEKALELALDREHAQGVANELADVMMFALEFASVCGIDVVSAMNTKLLINTEKYPVSKSKGSSRKYNQL